MTDVARLAGVSLGTVSNTLNAPSKVTPSTRERVMRAIDALGFVRNGTASSLAAGVSRTIGLVLVDLGNSFFLDMARGAERAADRNGFSTLLTDSDVDARRQDNYLQLFDETRVAGVILAPLEGALDAMERVRARGTPVVLLNYPATSRAMCSVTVDERLGGRLAVEHLIAQGARRIAFAGRLRYRAIRERLDGAREAATNAGLALEVIETDDLAIRHGRAVGHDLAARAAHDRPDGLVAGSDLLAVGVIEALSNHSPIRIPADLLIIGFDNNHFASDSYVPVSTIAQPAKEMGAAAVELIIGEARDGEGHDHREVVLPPSLIGRRSTSR